MRDKYNVNKQELHLIFGLDGGMRVFFFVSTDRRRHPNLTLSFKASNNFKAFNPLLGSGKIQQSARSKNEHNINSPGPYRKKPLSISDRARFRSTCLSALH